MAVIIPVRDRRDLLAETLDALDAQTFSNFEVIVIDDGSTDGTREMAAARSVAGRPVRVLDNPGTGPYAARQHAADSTSAELLAFTDSDCVPTPRWLEALVAAADAGADVVAGPTRPVRMPRPLERCMTSSGEDGGYPTCNVMYRRSSFEAAGGFALTPGHPLSFPTSSLARNFYMGEDTLMGWRMRRNGARPGFSEDAVVLHQVLPPDLSDQLTRMWLLSATPQLFKLVPELRETLLANKVFFQVRNRLLVYVMAGGLLARQPSVAGAALALWSALKVRRHLREGSGVGESLAALPAELASDVVATAALLKGSVQARTVVL